MPDVITAKLPKAPGISGLFASYRQWSQAGLELLFPPRCAGCGRVDTYWCARCQTEIDAIPLLARVESAPPLAAFAATAIHTGQLQQMLWALKYEDATRLAAPLGERLARLLQTLDWTFDILVPVPLHTTRLAQRGYNQSQLLADNLALITGQPCLPDALYRQRPTRSQVGLTAQERQANMESAFTANPLYVANQTLLLIDDVYTTGATLSACALAALDAGALAVYGLAVTRA